jgi:Uma2 family endonuclease
MGTRTLLTAEEYAQMHTPEMENYELVDGELIPLPSAIPIHGIICANVAFLVGSYLKRNPIGKVLVETDCRIADDTVRRPDLSIFMLNRLQQIDLKKVPVPFAPDIPVEVLSPSESAIDLNRKVRDYFSAGSKEVWVLDHENNEVFVYAKTAFRILVGSDVLESPLLPGLSASVQDLLTVS